MFGSLYALTAARSLQGGDSSEFLVVVFRGGGLTKDAVYLRGLVGLLTYLREGGALDPLLVGKLGPDHVPIIEELQWRKVLVTPPLRPRYLDDPIAAERLAHIRNGVTVLDLVKGARK